MKYLMIVLFAFLILPNAYAGFASGFKAGSDGVSQGFAAGEKARYREMLVRQQRERNRTGIIDVIDSKRPALVEKRLGEIQLGIDASPKDR